MKTRTKRIWSNEDFVKDLKICSIELNKPVHKINVDDIFRWRTKKDGKKIDFKF